MAKFGNLAKIVNAFQLPGGLDVERRTIGARNSLGESTPPAVSLLILSPVVVHPLVGAELEKLVEGDRDREHIRIFCRQKLFTAKAGTSQAADVVLYDANAEGNKSRYRVITAENHSANSLHWRCIAKKEEAA